MPSAIQGEHGAGHPAFLFKVRRPKSLKTWLKPEPGIEVAQMKSVDWKLPLELSQPAIKGVDTGSHWQLMRQRFAGDLRTLAQH